MEELIFQITYPNRSTGGSYSPQSDVTQFDFEPEEDFQDDSEDDLNYDEEEF